MNEREELAWNNDAPPQLEPPIVETLVAPQPPKQPPLNLNVTLTQDKKQVLLEFNRPIRVANLSGKAARAVAELIRKASYLVEDGNSLETSKTKKKQRKKHAR